MKCHYVPVFYLKRWTVEGSLIEFQRRRPGSSLVTQMRRSPAGTGWKKDLYSFSSLPEEKRHHIEKAFFSMVDSKAADALSLMENQSDVWNSDLRIAWALFLLSLITRHPQDIEAFKFVYARDFRSVSASEQQEYKKAKGSNDPESFEEFLNQLHPELITNLAVNSIPKLIMHGNAIESLINMHWSVCKIPDHGSLFTSDRPTIRTFLGRPDSHWLIPIGPGRLFVAAERKSYGLNIHAAVRRQGWKEVNKTVIRQAVELGYANSERHLPFFQKHLARATRPSAMLSFVSNPKSAPPLAKVP